MAGRAAERRGSVRILGACHVLHPNRGLWPVPPPHAGWHAEKGLVVPMGCEMVAGTRAGHEKGAGVSPQKWGGALRRVRESESCSGWLVELEGRKKCAGDPVPDR